VTHEADVIGDRARFAQLDNAVDRAQQRDHQKRVIAAHAGPGKQCIGCAVDGIT
jgi:hypothetical protein